MTKIFRGLWFSLVTGALSIILKILLDVDLLRHATYTSNEFEEKLTPFLWIGGQICLLLITVLIFRRIWNLRSEKNLSFVIFLLLLLGTILFYNPWDSSSWDSFQISIFFITLRLESVLLPIWVAWKLTRKERLGAILLLVAFLPAWINYPTKMEYSLFEIQHTIQGNGWVDVGLFVWNYLPVLCFLILIPIGVGWARTRRDQKMWLLLPSAVTLLILCGLRGVLITNFGENASGEMWISTLLWFVLAYLPLLFACLTFDKSPNGTADYSTGEQLNATH
jgi:uncharacterized membrane protein SirB2